MKTIVIILFLFATCVFAKFDRSWWQHATIYDIFVMSFKDSDGDGVGDLAGITSKLDYLQELGIHVVRLSSIYSSPDSITPNYGVDNFTQVHSKLGTLEDFEELIAEANKRGIKIILDIDFNHCHSSHEWFQKSVDGVEPFKDYFIWEDPIVEDGSSVVKPPNYRVSYKTDLFSWIWMEKRRQFYYTNISPELPNFYLYDQGLEEELKNILQFWLNKGVSGFNIKDTTFDIDEYVFNKPQKHKFQGNQQFFRELRDYIDIYNEESIGRERILMTDSDDCGQYWLKCLGNKDSPLLHIVSNHQLRYINYHNIFSESGLVEKLKKYFDHIDEEQTYEWKSLTLTRGRAKSGTDNYSYIKNTFTAVIPGIWHLLYGSELGIGGSYIRKKIFIKNDFNFDEEIILAMHWDDSKNAGFSDSNHPVYQPISDFWKINAKKEKNEEKSRYHFFKDLLEVRNKETMKHGDVNFVWISKPLMAIVRTLKEHETYITVMNIYNQLEFVDLNHVVPPIPNLIPKSKVVAASPNTLFRKGDRVGTSHFLMCPYSSVVLEMGKSKH